jgi:hypothetical protein
MFRYYVMLLSAFLLCPGFSGCRIGEKLRTGQVIEDTKKFRDAQKEHNRKFGNYGSIQDLVDKELLDSRFADGREAGYRFVLTVKNEHYQLMVLPESKSNSSNTNNEELSLYVDDSGIIRASVDPQIPANAESSQIASQ